MHRPSRHPLSIQIKQCLSALDHLINVELREAKLSMRAVHPFEVFVDPIHNQLCVIFSMNVCFSAFEALDTVVKSSVRRIELKVFERLNPWGLPTSVVHIVITMEHMVCCDTSESVLMICSWFV
jgi:hypothetical protein